MASPFPPHVVFFLRKKMGLSLDFQKSLKVLLLLCMYECFAQVNVCVPWACLVPEEAKRGL